MKRAVRRLEDPAARGRGDDDRRRHDEAPRLGAPVEHHQLGLDWERKPFCRQGQRCGAVRVDGIAAPPRPIRHRAAEPMRIVHLCEITLAVARVIGCVEAWVLTDRTNEAALRLYKSNGGIETPGDQVMLEFRLEPSDTAVTSIACSSRRGPLQSPANSTVGVL
jgi:hypothetical protein